MSQTYDNAFLQQSLGLERRASPRDVSTAKPVFGSGQPLVFRSPPPPAQFNDDGTESLEWQRYQSAQRLRQKWESIYDRFRDAHLEDQDEIYLGRARDANDKMRVIKDCGSLRSLRKQLKFGSFMSEQERKSLSMNEGWDDDDDDDDADVASPYVRPRRATTTTPTTDDNDVDIAMELDIYRAVKRDAIESLLQSDTLGRATLPYEIPGLDAMLTARPSM